MKDRALKRARTERLLAAIAVAALAWQNPARPRLLSAPRCRILERLRAAIAELETDGGVTTVAARARARALLRPLKAQKDS